MNPPWTPTPRRFLAAKRGSPAAAAQLQSTPQFQSTPRFGPSSAPRPTQRAEHRVEDVDEDDESCDGAAGEGSVGVRVRDSIEAESDAGSVRASVRDSIEAESDAVSALRDEDPSQGRGPEGDVWDDMEANSDGTSHAHDAPWTPEGREAKRRRVAMSPARESSPPTAHYGDTETASNGSEPSQQGPQDADSAEGASDEDQYSPSGPAAAARRAQQPVFQPAPRFKPTETDPAERLLPAAFSPQRRGARYLAGGLAAELQGWLSEVKGWEGGEAAAAAAAAGPTMRIVVDEVRPGRQMYLVKSRAGGDGSGAPARLMLAGSGRLTGLAGRAGVTAGRAVTVGQPVWQVELEGETWTVACDWAVEDDVCIKHVGC